MKFWGRIESSFEQQYDMTLAVDFPISNGSPAACISMYVGGLLEIAR
jgi:hypothetical protein